MLPVTDVRSCDVCVLLMKVPVLLLALLVLLMAALFAACAIATAIVLSVLLFVLHSTCRVSWMCY